MPVLVMEQAAALVFPAAEHRSLHQRRPVFRTRAGYVPKGTPAAPRCRINVVFARL